MKGHPIIFPELTVSCFPALGHKTLLAGTVSFEEALLGHLALFNFYISTLFGFSAVRKHGNYSTPSLRCCCYESSFVQILSIPLLQATKVPPALCFTRNVSPWTASFNHLPSPMLMRMSVSPSSMFQHSGAAGVWLMLGSGPSPQLYLARHQYLAWEEPFWPSVWLSLLYLIISEHVGSSSL